MNVGEEGGCKESMAGGTLEGDTFSLLILRVSLEAGAINLVSVCGALGRGGRLNIFFFLDLDREDIFKR